ncbi:hypothetical protein TWF694_000207 [Orbilia ellipsospora]|uniref:Uncharacterized protein n=1 Tax=Orbilia ellipsospora TaxID=2528407 RepID=A0AAV9XPB9_9PEZI
MTTSVVVFPQMLTALELQAEQVPQKARTRYTSDIERIQIVTLLSVGHKPSAIATKYGISRDTATRLLKRAISRGYDENDYTSLKMEHIKDDERSGRPAKATPAIQQQVVELAGVKDKSGQRTNTLREISGTVGLSQSSTGRIIRRYQLEKRRKPTPTKTLETGQAGARVHSRAMQRVPEANRGLETNRPVESNGAAGRTRAVENNQAPENHPRSIHTLSPPLRSLQTEPAQRSMELDQAPRSNLVHKEADSTLQEINRAIQEINRAREMIKLPPIKC